MSYETYSILKGNKYEFGVRQSTQMYGNTIIGRTFTIGGDYEKCVTVSYKYKNNMPIQAFIPYLLYEPECSIDSTLERGGGSEIMIKTLLKHAYSEIPSISIFLFDDMSKIDCISKDLTKSPERKIQKPLNLAFFSIAYYSKTWYELHFNAVMNDLEQYKKYRERLDFLTNPEEKPEFQHFLEIAQPPIDQIEMLKSMYETTETYRDFFNAIPKVKRCDILYSWLTNFMKYYIGDIYTESNWMISIDTLDKRVSLGGGYTRKLRNKKVRKQMYRIYDYKEYHSF